MRAFPILLILLLASASQQQDFFPRIITIDGRLTRADYERHIEREFQVPAGTRRVEIEYAVSGAERRTVVDLGLRGPSGLRGWSGGSKRRIFVSALGATPGYLPGADGQTVEWIRNGERIATQPVGAGGLRRVVEARDGDWFSVVVRAAAGRVTVFANAI